MPAINYIKRYAKHLLNDYKTKPQYQSLRDSIGVENLTMEYVKNTLAKNMNFESWDDLLKVPEAQRRFIKHVLSHPYLHPSGVHDKNCAPNWTDAQWDEYRNWMIHYFTQPDNYQLAFYLLIRAINYFKPIKSINYKTPHDELYAILEPLVLLKIVPDGSFDYGTFILGMLMAEFRAVKRGDKVYFNISEKSVRDIKQMLEFRKRLNDANADGISYDINHPNGVLYTRA